MFHFHLRARLRARRAQDAARSSPLQAQHPPAPYLSPVKGVAAELEKLDPKLSKSELVNPPDALRARLKVFKWLEEAEETEFNKLFQDAIGA